MFRNYVQLVLIALTACGTGAMRVAASAEPATTHRVHDGHRGDDDRPPKPPKPPKPPAGNNKPTAKVRGAYVLKVAGYYTGSGEADVGGTGVSITGKVKDPNDKEYKLEFKNLEVTDDRFRGTGTVGSMDVDIDGRLDPKDDGNGNVLKRGRITLTFRDAGNHRSRAAGEMKASEK